MSYSKRIILILLMVFACLSLAHSAVTTQVKPDKIELGDTFNLLITSDGSQSPTLDLTPLQQDFRILGTERMMNYTVMNGQAQRLHQFTVFLMPKKKGVLTIPALKVGQSYTKKATITVSDEPAAPATKSADLISAADDVMLQTNVSTQNPYISQQVIYTVKLYNSGQLIDSEYQPPHVDNALLIPLGNADRYQTRENGRDYVVEEQRYALFAQKSGTLTIRGPSFQAVAYTTRPRPINIPSKTTELAVKPIPASFKDKPWLPAKHLSLSETYDQSNTIQQGDTLTRTVTVEAVAVPAQLIPSLAFDDQKNFNVYPEKPMPHNVIRQNELVGQKTIKVMYLLNQAGNITIPELKLPWFNTQTGQMEVAKLPARTVHVKASAKKPSAPSSDNQPAADQIKTSEHQSLSLSDDNHINLMPWLLALIFGIAWIFTLILWWIKPSFTARDNQRRAMMRIRQACKNNNPLKAQAALLRWASFCWPDKQFLNLNDIIQHIHDPVFKRELNALSSVLYRSDAHESWQGRQLWMAVAAYRKKTSTKKRKRCNLPPINPSL